MRPAVFLGVLCCASLVGCSDHGRVPTYEVTGKVTFPDGTPLNGGWIIFNSLDPSLNQALAARGTINKDGTFRLGTYDVADGAVAGPHSAAIMPARPKGYDPDNPVQPKDVIDPRFKRPDTSGLKFTVKPDGENHFEIEVHAPDSN